MWSANLQQLKLLKCGAFKKGSALFLTLFNKNFKKNKNSYTDLQEPEVRQTEPVTGRPITAPPALSASNQNIKVRDVFEPPSYVTSLIKSLHR